MRRLLAHLGIAFILTALLFSGTFILAPNAHAASRVVGPKQYYLALGDSLAFGYQPDLDWSHGYPQYLAATTGNSLKDYGCNGETSTTMINGVCKYWYTNHIWYLLPQLQASVNFLTAHPGQVSPVTLDMGANDLLPDINPSTCAVASTWASDLARVHTNLTTAILPQLTAAMTDGAGNRTGDLVMMNYYDPYINKCPNSLSYIKQLNSEIANDAAQFHIALVDVYKAFGGDGQGANICTYTWICSVFGDIHATDLGYSVIANAFAAKLGY